PRPNAASAQTNTAKSVIGFMLPCPCADGAASSRRAASNIAARLSSGRQSLGKGRGHDLDDKIAALFQLTLYGLGLCQVGNDGHAGFVGSPRIAVQDR